MSLKEKIKAAQDIKKEVVKVPVWDVEVEVRTMSGKQRSELLSTCMDENGKLQQDVFQVGTIIASCYDPETGNKLFTADDADWLMDKASGPIELLAGKAMRLSGLTRDSAEQAEKN